MKRTISLAVLAAVSTLLLAAYSAPKTHDAEQSLRDTEIQWNADFIAHDAAKLAAHYADDATLMNTGQPPIVGKAAIEGLINGMETAPTFGLVIHTQKAEVAKSGDIGFTQGAYELTLTDPASNQVIHDHGSYVTTYRNVDGAWKAVSDISSSQVIGSTPPPK